MPKGKYHQSPGISHKDPDFYEEPPASGVGVPAVGNPDGNLDQDPGPSGPAQQNPFRNLRNK